MKLKVINMLKNKMKYRAFIIVAFFLMSLKVFAYQPDSLKSKSFIALSYLNLDNSRKSQPVIFTIDSLVNDDYATFLKNSSFNGKVMTHRNLFVDSLEFEKLMEVLLIEDTSYTKIDLKEPNEKYYNLQITIVVNNKVVCKNIITSYQSVIPYYQRIVDNLILKEFENPLVYYHFEKIICRFENQSIVPCRDNSYYYNKYQFIDVERLYFKW